MASSRKKEKTVLPTVIVLVAVAVLLLIAVLTDSRPSTLRVDLENYYSSRDGAFAVVRDNQLTHEDIILRDGVVYTSVTYLKEKLNKRFYYDETEKLLLYSHPSGTREADMKSLYEGAPVLLEEDGGVYVQLGYVQQYTALTWQLYEEPQRLVMRTVFGDYGEVQAVQTATIRSGASQTKPIMTQVESGEPLYYLEEQAEWDYVCTADGIPGYVSKAEVNDPVIRNAPTPYAEPAYSMPEPMQNIGLVWQQIQVKAENGDLERLLSKASGVDVVCPTWLFLKDGEGNFDSSASADYVRTAHRLGIQVWALLNNMDHAIYGDELCSVFDVTSHRRRLIDGIMDVLRECGADGINVDIESLPEAGGPGFLQFIRELSLACHKEGLILSVDNYVPSAWTAHYDRKEQSVFADYLIVMAYDEHYAGSEAGSTASLPFVIKGVEDSLAQIPAYKLICGVPFFTRLWVGSGRTPSSSPLDMRSVSSYLERYEAEPQWNTELGQSYAEFILDGEQARIWIEDVESMSLRLDRLSTYGLAGIAAWRLGMEVDEVWTVWNQFFESNQTP
ncbi:MAG: hypothetical protein J5493_04060 [Lachnospiraceae bacterium]|nr:hypothetical protein [Lachnospiraceae bacterium]